MVEAFKIIGRIALEGNEEAQRELEGLAGTGGKTSSSLVSSIKKIGTAIATYFAIDKIVSFGKACVNVAAEVAAEQAAFGQIMGEYSDEAQTKINEIATATGITSTRMTPYMTSMTAKFKGLGYDVADATDYAQRGLLLAADASAFWDKSLDDSMSHLNSFINGSYEGGEAIGLFANDTQMAAYAVEQGIVSETKAWAELDEATKQATRLQYAENMMVQSGATGQAAKEAGAYANVQANLTEAWRQFQSIIGTPILEKFVLPAMAFLTNNVMPKLTTWVQRVIAGIGPLWEKFRGWGMYVAAKFSPAMESIRKLWAQITAILKPFIDRIKNSVKQSFSFESIMKKTKIAVEKVTLVVKGIVDWISKFIKWLQSGSTGAEIFKAVIVGLAAAFAVFAAAMAIKGIISSVTNAIQTAKAAFAVFNAVLAANPIVLIVAAIAALVVAFIYLWNNCEGFREFWINLWNVVKEWTLNAVEWLRVTFTETIPQFFIDLWNKITETWNNIVNTITTFVMNIWTSITTWFTNTYNSIVTTVVNIWTSITTWFTNTYNSIVTTVMNIWLSITTWFSNIYNSIVTTVMNIWTTVTMWFSTIWNTIVTICTNIWNSIVNIWNSIVSGITLAVNTIRAYITLIFNAIKLTITNIWNGIKTFFMNVWNGISTTVRNAINTIRNTVTTIFNSVKTSVTNIWTGIKTSISDAITNAKTKVSNMVDNIRTKVTGAFNTVKTTVTNVWNGIKNAIKTPIEAAKTIVSDTIDAIKGFFDFTFTWPSIPLPHFSITPVGWGIGDLFDGVIPSLGITWYAKGGVLNGPTIFGYDPSTGRLQAGGEAGPEAVAPIGTLMDYVRTAVAEQTTGLNLQIETLTSIVAEHLPGIAGKMDRPVLLDSGALVSAIAPQMDDRLGNINRMKGRGN